MSVPSSTAPGPVVGPGASGVAVPSVAAVASVVVGWSVLLVVALVPSVVVVASSVSELLPPPSSHAATTRISAANDALMAFAIQGMETLFIAQQSIPSHHCCDQASNRGW